MTGNMRAVVNAWTVEGSHPGYHRQMQAALREKWPTLYWALVALAESNTSHPAEESARPEPVAPDSIVRLTVNLAPSVANALRDLCDASGVTITEGVRLAIVAWRDQEALRAILAAHPAEESAGVAPEQVDELSGSWWGSEDCFERECEDFGAPDCGLALDPDKDWPCSHVKFVPTWVEDLIREDCAVKVTAEQVETASEAAFMSDDLAGHHKAYPGYYTPHTWQNIPEVGRENYRRLVRDILAALGIEVSS